MAALRRGTAPHATPRPSPLALAARRLRDLAARPLRAAALDVLEFLLPQRCPGCGVPADPVRFLCERCHARLPRLANPVCARCLLEDLPPDGCRRHPNDQVHAVWLYDDRVALLVHALKFAGRPELALELAPAMAALIPRARRATTLVTAVPLHAARRRERGYDQAAELGEALASELGAPFMPGLLERTRATIAQSALGSQARRRNLTGAFRLAHPSWVRGRDVLVVDDVLTTGATLHEAMGTLRAAGARTQGAVLAWAQ